MKTATLRDLRNNFPKLENWLREGETIEVRRRKEVVAVLTHPSQVEASKPMSLPDFKHRRESLGLRRLDSDALELLRSYEEEDQEG